MPELRVSTVTPASIACLRKAGAWTEVKRHATMFSHMQVWGRGEVWMGKVSHWIVRQHEAAGGGTTPMQLRGELGWEGDG